jgi:hypothetical protein
VSDSAIFDQAVANLRALCDEMRGAAGGPNGVVQAQAVQCWTEAVDTAIADLLEVERRARYADVLAVCEALVDATVDGPPAAPSVIPDEACANAFAPSR